MQNFKKFTIGTIAYIIVCIIAVVLINLYVIPDKEHPRLSELEQKSFKDFEVMLKNEEIAKIYANESVRDFVAETKDGDVFLSQNPQTNDFVVEVLRGGAIVDVLEEFESAEKIEGGRKGKRNLGIFGAGTVLLIILLIHAKKQQDGEASLFRKKTLANTKGSATTSGSGKRTESAESSTPKRFSDIAGLKEVKKDIACLVDFVKNREKYEKAGAVLPKGVVLYGPPGTGKTLLAKAIAGEAEVPFLYASGSDFVEMYVGVGAKRIRELFEKARKQAPCVVFIDEIDAIGGKRTGTENSEDRKAVNALLTEMDGFHSLDSVMVVGATNRIEDLDPALLRPGRFSDKFCVPLPETVSERLEIINLYAKNKKFSKEFDFEALSKETVGFSPAKIESLLNEAAIIQVQDGKENIDKAIVDKAMYKVLLSGHQKESSSERRKEEMEVVAWHEAGHALVGAVFGKEITKVTIAASTSGAGGVTFSIPTKTSLLNKEDIKKEVMELYAGRIGELFYYKGDKEKVTTGASNDIERATQVITDYVTKYGMSAKYGMVNLSVAGVSNNEIISAVVSIANDLEQETEKVVKEHEAELKKLATLLLERETIYAKDVQTIVQTEN